MIGPGGEQRASSQEIRLEGWVGARLLRAMCTVLKGLTFAQYSMGGTKYFIIIILAMVWGKD